MVGYLIYGFVFMVCVYPFSQIVLKETCTKPYDSFDRNGAVFFGALLAAFWPLFLTIIVSYKLSKHIWMKIVREDEEVKHVGSSRLDG